MSFKLMTSSSRLEFSSDSPHEGDEFACDGGDDDVMMLASGGEVSVTPAESHLSFPSDILDRFGEMFLAFLDEERDSSRETVGPGGFDESSSCVGVAGLGDASEAAVVAAGVLARVEAEEGEELAGIVEAGDIAEFGGEGDGDGELDAAESLKGFDEVGVFPGSGSIAEFGFDTLEALGAFGDSADVFLEDDLLSGSGQSDPRELVEMSGAPDGSAGVLDVVSKQERLEAELGGFEIAHGILACAREIADRFVVDIRDMDRSEIAGSQQACEGDGVAAIGLDSIAGFAGDERWCDDEAGEALLGEIAVEREAARPCFVSEDEARGFGLESSREFVDVAEAGADGAEEDDFIGRVLRGVGDGNGTLMDIQADEKCGRMVHG